MLKRLSRGYAAVLGSSPPLRFAPRSPRFQILGHCYDKQLSPVS